MPKETKQVGWQMGDRSAWVELAETHIAATLVGMLNHSISVPADGMLVSYRVSKKQRLQGVDCLETMLVTGPQVKALEAANKLAKEFVGWPKEAANAQA